MKTTSLIVTFNPNLEILKKQIESLIKFSTVVIVDNSSSNINCIEIICTSFKHSLSLIKLTENIGLASAQNKGIAVAEKIGCTHVIFFDQDSYLDKHSFRALQDAERKLLALGENVGAVGPVCYDPNDFREYPITKYFGPFIKRVFLPENTTQKASFLIASGSLVRIDVLRSVGGMMDELFIDYIDVEWSYRAQSKGFVLFATSSSRMSHLIGDARIKFFGRTISKHSPLRRYYLTRNSFKIVSLSHIPIAYKIREFFLILARIFAFYLVSNEKWTYTKFIFHALLDAFNGNYGKYKERVN
jgi:rhamnosyltransferase